MSYEVLYQYIESKSSLSLTSSEKDRVQQLFKARHLRKRQYLLQQGDICKHMGFIVNGAGRMYAIKENSQETIIRLAIESWWLGDYESYNLQKPSDYFIEMTEDSDVLLITYSDLNELTGEIPAINRMIKEIDRKGIIATQKRIHSSISLDAQARYDQLAKMYPEFIRRFPQSMIASYLGISAETLSRVRKKILYK